MADTEAPAELVAGKYELTRLIGQGGMGSVWEGVHKTLQTRVAVKFIDREHADSPEARNRFKNEAKAAAALNSKHVVQVHDHGITDDGSPYIVMEFLSGESLDARLDRVTRLSPAETCDVMRQVSRALTKAHERGIVHRDLKPENIFLVWDEEDHADIAKVVDFGIAKFTDPDMMTASSSTKTGSVMGTPYYMSPEQARGLRTVDFRTDLWALGVITYRCITGRLAFEGEAVGDLLVKICTEPVPVPSQHAVGIPEGFDAWFAKALDRDPEQRFQSASEMVEQLYAACGVSLRGPMPSSLMTSSGEPPALRSGPVAAMSGYSSDPTIQADSAARTAPSPSATAAPLTQSTGGLQPVRTRKVPVVVVAAAAGLLLVVGGGAAVALVTGGGEEPISPVPAVSTEQAPAEPSSAAEPDVSPVIDEAAAADSDEAEPAASAEPETKPKTGSKAAAARPTPKAVAPEPPPAALPKPQPKPRPQPKPSTPDIGY